MERLARLPQRRGSAGRPPRRRCSTRARCGRPRRGTGRRSARPSRPRRRGGRGRSAASVVQAPGRGYPPPSTSTRSPTLRRPTFARPPGPVGASSPSPRSRRPATRRRPAAATADGGAAGGDDHDHDDDADHRGAGSRPTPGRPTEPSPPRVAAPAHGGVHADRARGPTAARSTPGSRATATTSRRCVSWTRPRPGTVELALLVTDDDADGFVHWAVAGIAPTAGGIAEGARSPARSRATTASARPAGVGRARRREPTPTASRCTRSPSRPSCRRRLAPSSPLHGLASLARRRGDRHLRPPFPIRVLQHPSVPTGDLRGLSRAALGSVVERDALEVRRRTSRSPRRGGSGRARSAGRSAGSASAPGGRR